MQIDPLSREHPVGNFVSSHDVLTRWLRTNALFNNERGYSRTFVGLDESGMIVGYYALSAASIERSAWGLREHGAPKSIPLILLARWAVSVTHQGRGFGKILLEDALMRCLRISEDSGIRAIIVNPIDETAEAIYAHFGFRHLFAGTMYLSIEQLRQS